MKIKYITAITLTCLIMITGCTQGLVSDEVPESVYTELGLGSGLGKIRVRELFENKVWQVNHNNGQGQWLDKVIYMTQISQGYEGGRDYTNNTGSDVTIMGTVVKPGEKMYVKNTLEEVSDASAPDGKKYIVHMFSPTTVQYSTPNKGHLFVQSAFDKESVKPEMVNPVDGRSQSIILPVRQEALVVEFILANPSACRVEPVGGAPALGTPSDFTKPQQYMVINYANRPPGVPEYKRLYEIRVQLLKE